MVYRRYDNYQSDWETVATMNSTGRDIATEWESGDRMDIRILLQTIMFSCALFKTAATAHATVL